MKVERVEIQSTKIPTFRSHKMAIGTTTHQENVVVRVFGDNGVDGVGESPFMVGHSQPGETPDTARVIMTTRLVPALEDVDPFELDAVFLNLERAVPGNLRAKGAVMTAIHDLVGKTLGTPLHTLLGGKVRDRVPLSWSLPIVDQKTALEEAGDRVSKGWRILKIKAGRGEPDDDVKLVAALRKEFGDDLSIRADANQAYDVKTAVRVIRSLEPYNIDFFEQPVHRTDFEGLRYLARDAGLTVPIMADEAAHALSDFARICRMQAADMVSIYIIGPGGPSRSRAMAVMAEHFRMRGYVGGALESGIGTAAGLHLAASSASIDLGCEMVGPFMLESDIVTELPTMDDGALVVPTGPGLGVELDEEALAKYRVGDVETVILK
jgi:muconate cycloisomerase